MPHDPKIWPSLPLAEWRDTHDTLHMWLQIVGKTRLALAPKENHFDFIDHRLVVKTSDGSIREMALRPQAVADFYRQYMGVLERADHQSHMQSTQHLQCAGWPGSDALPQRTTPRVWPAVAMTAHAGAAAESAAADDSSVTGSRARP
jgi:hypothetical protein